MRVLHLLAAVVCAALMLVASAAADAGGAPAWQAPTPADGSVLTLGGGAPAHVVFAAGEPGVDATIHIAASELPAGASFVSTDGNPATATLDWTPTPGEHAVEVAAVDVASGASVSLGVTIHVPRPAPAPPERISFSLSGPGPISRSALVVRPTSVRAAPSATARVVAHVSPLTVDAVPNLVELVGGARSGASTWIRIRLSILPNDSTGWVPRSSLGPFRVVRTRLVVDRGSLTATLYRGRRAIFRAPVGVGAVGTPTPAGRFFVREKLTGFTDPFYGPLAFGTNARSAVLTDWPGGGFIGIHGTNAPSLLPGRVSHGCIRMRNDDILRLAALMPLGTPLTIR